jgi:hypothetical protein
MSMGWPIQVYSVDDAIEKAKHGRYPFKVSVDFAPTLIGNPLVATNEDELSLLVQKAFSASQNPNPIVMIEPI